MKLKLKKHIIFLFSVMFCTFFGCAFIDDYDDEKSTTEDQTLYEAGSNITALGYDDAASISLYIKEDDAGENSADIFKVLSNGDYVTAGIHTLGIEVTPRIVNGIEADQRVFVSDGGWAYQVEALKDDTSGCYICDFQFMDRETYIVHPVLVKVVYPLDQKASKEKFVVTTWSGLRPEAGMLVEKGLGLALSKQALHSMTDALGVFLEETEGLEIRGLTPVVHENDDQKGLLHLSLGVGALPVSLDLALKNTYFNENDEPVRALTLGLENFSGGEPENFIESITSWIASVVLGTIGEPVINLFKLDEIPVMPVSFPLSTMLAGLGGSGEDDGQNDDPLTGLLQTLNLGSTLFLDIYGMPELNDENFAVIGGGLYAADTDLIEIDENGNALWPDVQVDQTDPRMDIDQIKTDITDIGIALTQYNLNQVLCGMMQGFSLTMNGIGDYIPFVAPENPENALDLYLTANPAGIALDMSGISGDAAVTAARLSIRDMRGEFLEEGTPKAMISIDLCLDMTMDIIKQDGKMLLVLSLTPVNALSYIHVLKDDLGMDIYDHSTLIPLIVSGIMGSNSDAIVIPLPLSDMGLVPGQEDGPGSVSYDGKGNCFMNLAVESIDISAMGLCFISTAGL